MMSFPGMGELLVIFCIVLVLFGGGKLAGVGKSLGSAISEFKAALNTDPKKDEEKATEKIDEKKES
jgi:sec-independent protein translocase protein TatA